MVFKVYLISTFVRLMVLLNCSISEPSKGNDLFVLLSSANLLLSTRVGGKHLFGGFILLLRGQLNASANSSSCINTLLMLFMYRWVQGSLKSFRQWNCARNHMLILQLTCMPTINI